MSKMVKVGWGMHLTDSLENHAEDWFQYLIQMSHSNAELTSKSNFYDISPFYLRNGNVTDFDQDAFSFHGELLMTSFVQTEHCEIFSQELTLLNKSLYPSITDHTAEKYNIGFALFEHPFAERENHDNSILTALFLLQDAGNPFYQELFAFSNMEGQIPQLLHSLSSNLVDMNKLFELVKRHIDSYSNLKKLLPKSFSGSIEDQYTAMTAFLLNSQLGYKADTTVADNTFIYEEGAADDLLITKMLAFGVEVMITYYLNTDHSEYKRTAIDLVLPNQPEDVKAAAEMEQRSDGLRYINPSKLSGMVNFEKLFRYIQKNK